MMFRTTLSALALGAAMLLGACVDQPGSDTQNTVEIFDSVMAKAPEAPGELDITRDAEGNWLFNGVGARGERVLFSQQYAARASAINGILSVEENGVLLERYQVRETPEGDWTFALRAGNNQEIATGPLYRSQAEAEEAVVATRDLVAGIVQYKAAITDGARFDLWKDTGTREWFFVMRSEDGRTVLASEAYNARTGAVNGIESVRVNGKLANRYQLRETANGVSFILRAANNQEIAESGETFPDAERAQAAIDETRALLESERVAAPW